MPRLFFFVKKKNNVDKLNDGDTVSCKLCFSLEANKEAQEISESVRSFVSPDGKMLRFIKNEGYLSFYNMTRHDETGHGTIPADKKKLLLSLKKL